jgi:hypothetical protein
MNIETKKTMMSRDVIWLNKTYSEHMKITQVAFVSSEVEEDEIEDEEEVGAEQEGYNHVGPPPPITEDDFVEQQMDVPQATAPIAPVPYPKVSRELRSLQYGNIGPAPKRMTRELRGLQSNLHIAYINNQVLPDHDKEYAMLNAAINSVAGFDYGSDTPKTYRDVLKHSNQKDGGTP